MEGYLSLSSTIIDKIAAVKALVVLPV
jgi:hypothetical protein